MSYVGQEEQSSTITITGMYSQLAINTALGLGTLIVFGILRPRNGIVYAPKQRYSPEKKQPPKLETGLFSWIKPVITVPESQLIEKIGLDAVMYLRFISLCRNLFLWLFFMGICILVPLNVYGTLQDSDNKFPTSDNPLQFLSISYLISV
ncbi:9527_t:CDS:2, partial [Dentiscutata heterogama]